MIAEVSYAGEIGGFGAKIGRKRPVLASPPAKSRRTQPVRGAHPLGAALPPSRCATATRRVRATHPATSQHAPRHWQTTTQPVPTSDPASATRPPAGCEPTTPPVRVAHPAGAEPPPAHCQPATQRAKPSHPAGLAQPPAGSAAAILQARRAFLARQQAADSIAAPSLPPLIEPDESYLRQIATLPIPEAIQMLERVTKDTERHQLATSLGFVWSARDINLAWNSVTRSALDAATKQILYNTLWG